MASLTIEAQSLLRNAYIAGLQSISEDLNSAHFPAESFDALTKIEEHRWFWRPKRPSLILIAESHVYTSAADLGVSIYQAEIISKFAAGHPLPAHEFVGLVYCLGYGEKKLLLNTHADFTARSTWQFWDLFGRIAGTGIQPRVSGQSSLSQRLDWSFFGNYSG
jgi:hypothetical protein